jgi:hypothetical protein
MSYHSTTFTEYRSASYYFPNALLQEFRTTDEFNAMWVYQGALLGEKYTIQNVQHK